MGSERRRGNIILLLHSLVIHHEQEYVPSAFHGERSVSPVRGMSQNLHAANTIFQLLWVKQIPANTEEFSKITTATVTNVLNTNIQK